MYVIKIYDYADKFMLGISKLSPGRIGNRLFHYNLLRQISKKTGIDYYHIKFPESQYFPEMRKKPRHWPNINKPVEVFSRDLLAVSPEQFLENILEQNQKGRDILFSPPMLGETFFDYLFYDPNDFLIFGNKYMIEFNMTSENSIIVGLHFRGSDFPAWDEKAALNYEYYESAIDYCVNYFNNKKIFFCLFTDDLEYPAYKQTLLFLKSKKDNEILLGDPYKEPIYDFYRMSQCDVLISSPSTFAIFAGILGKRKKIIHNKDWLNYAVEKKDMFWVRLSDTTNPYYRLWKVF